MNNRRLDRPLSAGDGTGRTRSHPQKAVVTVAGQIRPADDYRPALGDILVEVDG